MAMMLLPSTLMAVSAAVIFLLGALHLFYMVAGNKFLPRDTELRTRLEQVSPVISRQTTMWKVWVGCHASHSYGLLLFGAVSCPCSLATDTMRSGKFAVALTAGLLAGLFSHVAAQSVTKAEKEEFRRLLAKAPSRDLYPFLAASAGLCERPSSREYGVAHFSEIAHPTIKLGWAVLLFKSGATSPALLAYLRAAFDSPERSKDLAQMLGPELAAFKKRVVGH